MGPIWARSKSAAVWLPPLRKGRVKKNFSAATANARVTTANSRPRARSAPMPTTTDAPAATAVPHTAAHKKCSSGMGTTTSNPATPSPRSFPLTKAVVVSAPRPANAPCPKEICPLQPTSTTRESAASAISRISL